MAAHSTIDELLTDAADRDAFEAEARNPKATVDSLWQWLLERGFTASRSAVGRWIKKFRESELESRMRKNGDLARITMEMVEKGGVSALGKAAIVQTAQRVFELAESGDLDAESVNLLTLAMQRGSLALVRFEDAEKMATERLRKALEGASKVAETGGSAGDVVATVREILGIGGKAA